MEVKMDIDIDIKTLYDYLTEVIEYKSEFDEDCKLDKWIDLFASHYCDVDYLLEIIHKTVNNKLKEHHSSDTIDESNRPDNIPVCLIDDMCYPTDEFVAWITDFYATETSIKQLISVIRDAWRYPEIGFISKQNEGKSILELHTFGCSGNECIIRALRANQLFFPLYFEKEERGGHFTFTLPVVY